MKKLGIIGGLGPMATAYFFQLIIEMTRAESDQEHIEVLIHNCPSIPDRTKYILGKSDRNPVEAMVAVGKNLVANRVDVLAIPCVTAHYFHRDLEDAIGMPVLHAVQETARYLKEREYNKVGIMATDGTVQMGIFSRELKRYGIESVCPDEKGQAQVMSLIYDCVKAGKPVDMEKFRQVSQELFQKGAQVIILGCTELSMIKKNEAVGSGYLDVTELLAKCCVEQCGVLKDEYKELIT